MILNPAKSSGNVNIAIPAVLSGIWLEVKKCIVTEKKIMVRFSRIQHSLYRNTDNVRLVLSQTKIHAARKAK